MRATAETSALSYTEVKQDGTASLQRLAILNLLRAAPNSSFSRNDLATMTGFRLGSVCGRVGELKAAGLVIELAKRRCPQTGKLVKPVKIAPDLLSTSDAAIH
jgi:hypothetical protein